MALLGPCKDCAEWKERYDEVFAELKEAWRTIASLRQQGFHPKATLSVQRPAPSVEAEALHRAEGPVGDAMVEGMVKEMTALGISESAARIEADQIRRTIGSTFTQQP